MVVERCLLIPTAHAKHRALPGQLQSFLLLPQCLHIGVDRQFLLGQAAPLVCRQHFQLAISILLRLDHIGAGVSDLLIQLDPLRRAGSALGPGCFEGCDFGLVGRRDFLALVAD